MNRDTIHAIYHAPIEERLIEQVYGRRIVYRADWSTMQGTHLITVPTESDRTTGLLCVRDGQHLRVTDGWQGSRYAGRQFFAPQPPAPQPLT